MPPAPPAPPTPFFAGTPYATHVFTFDYVYDQDSTQQQVYDNTARSVVDSSLQGYNATIFAYGQTGTGKVRASTTTTRRRTHVERQQKRKKRGRWEGQRQGDTETEVGRRLVSTGP